jgi:hypothetical protein
MPLLSTGGHPKVAMDRREIEPPRLQVTKPNLFYKEVTEGAEDGKT